MTTRSKQGEKADNEEEVVIHQESTNEGSILPPPNKGSAQVNENNHSRRTTRCQWILALSYCLGLIIALQSVTIWLLVDKEDDTAAVDRSVEGQPHDKPSALPSEAPSLFPTAASSVGFQSIASVPGAVRLNVVSDCDDCSTSFRAPPGFIIPWSTIYSISTVTVESNGYISIDCNYVPNSSNCGLIHAAEIDLAPSVNGDVYILWQQETTDRASSGVAQLEQPQTYSQQQSILVSWENVIIYGYWGADNPYKVNVQVKISNQEVQICYGDGDTGGEIFRSGYWNATSSTYVPAVGSQFDKDGYSRTFPNNTCQALDSLDSARPVTSSPSQRKTAIPTTNYSTPSPTTPPKNNSSYFEGYVSIKNRPGAYRLNLVSSCNDCLETIALPFDDYHWIGGIIINEFEVSTNGHVELLGDCESAYSSAPCAIVNVVSMALLPADNAEDGIWVYESPWGALIVSWENMPASTVWSGTDDEYGEARVSAQAHFHRDGRIDVCWGDIFLKNGLVFQSAVWDFVAETVYPATGPDFEAAGVTLPYRYPSNVCQNLVPARTTMGTPTSHPTSSSMSPPPAELECISSFGPSCVTTNGELQEMLFVLISGGTIALCGDIAIFRTINVVYPNVRICCGGNPPCSLNSVEGTIPIMTVARENVTLSGLSFQRGVSTGNGGNVAIYGEGYHTIADCEFVGGVANDYGGNLYIFNAESVTITNSLFESGNAGVGGGGAAFDGVRSVAITSSIFRNNEASRQGGGLLVFFSSPLFHDGRTKEVTITLTRMQQNYASVGAGFAMRDISDLRLAVMKCIFDDNFAFEFGGAGAAIELKLVAAEFKGNSGESSDSSGICPGFFIVSQYCLDVGEEFQLLGEP